MNTFTKIILVAAALIVAIKLSPVIFLAGLLGLLAAALLGVVGLSLLGVLVGLLIALTVSLAPIWIPVLAILGLISLFRRKETNVVTS